MASYISIFIFLLHIRSTHNLPTYLVIDNIRDHSFLARKRNNLHGIYVIRLSNLNFVMKYIILKKKLTTNKII